MGTTNTGFTATTSIKLLFVAVFSLVLVFLPLAVARAQDQGSSHHLQHVDAAACSAACSTSSSKTESRSSQRNTTSESNKTQKNDQLDVSTDIILDEPDRTVEHWPAFTTDKSRIYKTTASYLL